MDYLEGLSLGKEVEYVSRYSSELLCPIKRIGTRQNLGIDSENLPFKGVDVWNAYELSWLNSKGLPQVATAVFEFPSDSESIIESKSFKLYLNSFNQTAFDSAAAVTEVLRQDLTAAAGAAVKVSVLLPEDWSSQVFSDDSAECIDQQNIEIQHYSPDASLLEVDTSVQVNEYLVSHLLRSLCPVTGQPDWACVYIRYKGGQIDRQGLLKYIVGFREFQEFHEQCVERIFIDISAQCRPEALSVYARYVRRGGLDINPYRSTADIGVENRRLFRQ